MSRLFNCKNLYKLKPHRNNAFAVPLVLGVLAVFSILLLVLSRAGTQTYTQNALANYNLQARMHALAVVEYISTELHSKMCDPLQFHTYKYEVIDAILKRQPEYMINMMGPQSKLSKKMREILIGEIFKDPTNPGGFQGGERITDHGDNKLKQLDKFEILKAEVKFHHFKPIRFDTFNPSIYHDPTRYYHHPLMESSGIAPLGDLIGFCTIKVKVRFGFVERELAVTKDVKIINNEPMARNFALFAMGAPNAKYMQNDLNQGGRYTILANNKGRIRLQGPYIIDTEGYPDGTGGSRPVGLSYPEKKWDSSAFIPSPRGITTSGFAFSNAGIKRPKKSSGNGLSIGLGSTQGLSLVMSSDPGIKGMPEAQEYWAANRKVGEQKFSISGTAQNFNGWKGLMVQEGQSNSAVVGVFNGNLGELEKSTQARVEGSLFGRFNQMHYSKRSVCMSLSTIISGFMGLQDMFGGETETPQPESQNPTSITSNEYADLALDLVQACWINYQVKKKGTVPYYYGIHSPYSSKINKMESLLNIMNETLEAFSSKGDASDGGGFVSAAGTAIQQSSDRLSQAELTRNTISGEIKPYDERWAPDLFGVLPSNFKKFGRTSARKYDSIGHHLDIQGGKNKKELFLDGNIWVNELDLRDDIVYFGKGTLISAFTPGSVLFTAAKQARIKNLRPARAERDHLNLFYRNSNSPESAGGMLKLDGNFEGSLYSYQGVQPTGSDIRIKGNLIVELFNKAQTSDGENLTVEYNSDYLEADKQAYNWFTISLSPKISGLAHRFRTKATSAGAGEDGVKVILPTIGE